MTSSMTAYARKELGTARGQLVCEVRSLNHRYLDIAVRLPDGLKEIEQAVRKKIASQFQRGRFDCTFYREKTVDKNFSLTIDHTLLQQIDTVIKTIEQRYKRKISFNLLDILNWPGLLKPQHEAIDMIKDTSLNLLDETLAEVAMTRQNEGSKLKKVVSDRCRLAQEIVRDTYNKIPEINQAYEDKLHPKLAALQNKLDHERMEQEVLLLIQKYDISEELDRMTIHLEEVIQILNDQKPAGRRLDFLMQEINREANTLGAKSSHIHIDQTSINLKVLIEQMREQIQNIE